MTGVISANAIRLALPASMRRLHNVVNVDRLKRHGNELFIVEALLKQRQFNRKKEYLVKWHGLPEHEATWELERTIKHVAHFKKLVQDLREKTRETKATSYKSAASRTIIRTRDTAA
ncbi:hypothetical protein H310_14552 [Aphanomyces invadans]|uniref:Chromo domain-containing protein n=1 Tax=Aphanomyces invadans TaxID=157072 RepID=A0A024T9J0_9STRA|nr:hypothetical protein H310_14552 [Aphanomyces invadans]ETV90713.1 hypothetical protein H310_14552 [Aphanomyces invadans]|eukprot:XP_008880653.1 hypothetical protein H310_14552 [Aphanomyces invadans]